MMMEDQLLTTSFALVFGAAHAIEPGHGKTALFTYIASGKCTWKEGVTIALSSAITHSLVVLLIAYLSHTFFSHVENIDQQIISGLRYMSAFTICAIGIYIFRKKGKSSCSHCDSHHSHDHSHVHDHENDVKPATTKRSLLTSGLLGLATGLIPCPSVIVVYLAGLSSGNSYMGLKSVIFFAIGMTLSLIAVVIIFSIFGKKMNRYLEGKSFQLNWNKIQGISFLIIGFVTLVY